MKEAQGEEIKLEENTRDFISASLLLASQTPAAAFIIGGYADDVKAPLQGFATTTLKPRARCTLGSPGVCRGRGGERLLKLAQAKSCLS